MSSRLVSLLGSAPPLTFSKSADGPGFSKGVLPKREILILNSFSFEDKDPRFTRLKPALTLLLLSKGLFYIRAMGWGHFKAMTCHKMGKLSQCTFGTIFL